ncbi:MAG TPA: AAA family ATPase [Anaeromyxobacter sp.]|nr:AAA family ATPase [Anaeromyxobacter sp.]
MEGESFAALRQFLETAPVALRATRPLSPAACVNVALPDGPARFTMEGAAPALLAGSAQDPDFTLTLPGGAVRRITSLEGEDVGRFGIEFFKLVLERDPDLKVRIHIDAPASRLLAHGYLGVLAAGGLKVTWWLLKKGVKNPLAAIERLRGVR